MRTARWLVGLALVASSSACSKKPPPAATVPPSVSASAQPGASATATVAASASATAADAAAGDAATLDAASARRSLAGKKVLHVGDSMVGGSFGLTRALEKKLDAAGAKLVRHTQVSETIVTFDKGPTLRDLLRTHDPDIVLITLGMNDAQVPHPEAFSKNIQNIVRRVGDRECWWLGPPKGQADSALVKVLAENVGTCRFFDATPLELERAGDGIHPTNEGGARWADAFWAVFEPPAP